MLCTAKVNLKYGLNHPVLSTVVLNISINCLVGEFYSRGKSPHRLGDTI